MCEVFLCTNLYHGTVFPHNDCVYDADGNTTDSTHQGADSPPQLVLCESYMEDLASVPDVLQFCISFISILNLSLKILCSQSIAVVRYTYPHFK